MKFNKLRFSKKEAEMAYRNFKDANNIETFEMTLVFWAVLLASFAYPYLIDGNIPVILGFIVVLCAIALLFSLKKEMGSYVKHLTIFVTLLLLLSSLTYSVLKIDEDSKMLQFLRGWTFAGAEIVLINQFRKLKQKFLFVIVSFSVRCGFITFCEHEAFVEDVLVHNFVTDLFVVYVYYYCEIQERIIFKGYFDYREQFVKFKDLLENYLPQSVVVLEPQRFRPFFANKAFAQGFTRKIFPGVLCTTETEPLNVIAAATLDHLLIQKDSIRYSCKWESDPSRFENGVSLRHFLQELLTNDFFGMTAVTVACFHQSTLAERSLFEVVLMPLSWGGEEAVVIVLDDITFQEKLMAFKQADKNKEMIITTVSHELRTPLNAITGLLQIIEAKIKQPEVLKDVSLCRDNAAILSSLINSIVDLQLSSSGRLVLKLAKTDLYSLLKGTVRLFQFGAEQKGLYLNLKIGNDVERFIMTDENRLKQILVCLIGNAIKFTFDGGIEVIVEKDPLAPEHLRLSVRDTGVGIKDGEKKKLFKVYGNLEETNDVSKNGAGLGLTICNTLANAMLSTRNDERIHVESKYGVGTTFWFKIPNDRPSKWGQKIKHSASKRLASIKSSPSIEELLDDYDERIEPNIFKSQVKSHTLSKMKGINTKERSPDFHSFPASSEEIPLHSFGNFQEFSFSHQSSRHSKSLGPEKISEGELSSHLQQKGLVLIVDDNPFNLMVAQSVLVNLGYHVETAASGEEALTKSRSLSQKKLPLKFILMDIQMPVMDGYETTRQLKKMMKRNEIKETPIIALSANDQDHDIKNSLEAGMIAHISKPLTKDKLDACVSKL